MKSKLKVQERKSLGWVSEKRYLIYATTRELSLKLPMRYFRGNCWKNRNPRYPIIWQSSRIPDWLLIVTRKDNGITANQENDIMFFHLPNIWTEYKENCGWRTKRR